MFSLSRGRGLYVAAEEHLAVWGTGRSGSRAVLCGPGSHSLAPSLIQGAALTRAKALTDVGYVVAQGDMGQATGGTFGNDTIVTRLTQLRTFMLGATSPQPISSGPVHFIAGSGGCTAAINYARANPSLVASLYLLAPLVDLVDFYNNRTDAVIPKAEVDTAYGGAAAFAAALPTHNPSAPGNADVLSDIPIKLCYSTDDPYILPQTVFDYAEMLGDNATLSSMGAVGHTAENIDPVDVIRFFRAAE